MLFHGCNVAGRNPWLLLVAVVTVAAECHQTRDSGTAHLLAAEQMMSITASDRPLVVLCCGLMEVAM